MSRVSKIVDSVLDSFPLPDDWSDLQAGQRRKVEREALAAGVSPAEHWRAIKAATAAEAVRRRDRSDVQSLAVRLRASR